MSGENPAVFSQIARLASSAVSGLRDEITTKTLRKVVKITGATFAWIAAGDGGPPTPKRFKEVFGAAKAEFEAEKKARRKAA